MNIRKLLSVLSIGVIMYPGYLTAQHKNAAEAVDQAHEMIFSKFVDPYGLILDYQGEIPTPKDCEEGRPNLIGWWSPIENGPMFTGVYLPAVCERARRSGSTKDADEARLLAKGLIRSASVSDVPGFIVRGFATDGKRHYPLGSDDQTHPWFYGLHAYYKSSIPSESEKKEIAAKVKDIATVLESKNWQCPCDGIFKTQSRGHFKGAMFREAIRYLHMLRLTYDMTGDSIWLERYRKALNEPLNKEGKTRIQIVAEGYVSDRAHIKDIEKAQAWIYVGCQAATRYLMDIEEDATVKAAYKEALTMLASNMLETVRNCEKFDNNDNGFFGERNWREVYNGWMEQKTQDDAYKVSQICDKEKLGPRKWYEHSRMCQPLAGAAILAFSGDESYRPDIEKAISHYDYSKLNFSRFFYGECAYYALPPR